MNAAEHVALEGLSWPPAIIRHLDPPTAPAPTYGYVPAPVIYPLTGAPEPDLGPTFLPGPPPALYAPFLSPGSCLVVRVPGQPYVFYCAPPL